MIDYVLVEGPPQLHEYLELRRIAGLSPKTTAQGGGAISNSWAFCHIRTSAGAAVAMGRTIGDGGWYFHIADMATHPEHQRRGLGRRVLDWLLDDIRARAPSNPYVTLRADAPGRPLYRQVGFVPTAPETIGMQLSLEGDAVDPLTEQVGVPTVAGVLANHVQMHPPQ